MNFQRDGMGLRAQTLRALYRVWAIVMGLLPVVLVSTASIAWADTTYTFGYDDADRLVQMQSTAASATYGYDVAGNLISATAPGASSVAISAFSPATAAAGANVTLTGLGFSATPSSNTVKFNGVAASVVSASATSLVVVVPAGATSGAITVTVAGSTATSASSFTVAATAPGAQPTLTTVSKTIAAQGDTITLTGTNFLGSGNNIWVRVNGQAAKITSQSSTQIVFTVPSGNSGASSGRIEVGTQNGTVLQSSYLYITPSTSITSSVGTTQSISVGSALATSVASGQIGLFAFDGQAGQHIGFGVSAFSGAAIAVSVSLLAPDGSSIAMPSSCSSVIYAPGGACELPALPGSGTYTLVLTPSGGTANLTLSLTSEQTGTLATNQAPQTFSVTGIASYARYTFNALAGDNYSINFSGSTIAGSYSSITVFRPDGSQLTSNVSGNSSFDNASYANGHLDLRALPLSGQYTVLVSPYWSATSGSVNIALNATGSLSADGLLHPFSLSAGQNGYYSFYGVFGQHLGLGVTTISTTPSGTGLLVTLLRPDGQTLLTCLPNATADSSCNVPDGMAELPLSGLYTIVVTPYSSAAATFNLTLTTDAASSLTANGTAQTFTTSSVGQNARYTFNATMGQSASLVWSGSSFPYGSGIGYNNLKVFNPDGSLLSSASVGDTTSSYGSGAIQLANLPASGLYTVYFDPVGPNTGTIGLQLLADDAHSLAVDGSALQVTLGAGQRGDYTFTGSKGQTLGLGFGPVSWSASGTPTVSLSVPYNTTVQTLTCSWDARGGSCNLPVLPADGNYTLHVVPPGAASATLTMTLSSDGPVPPASNALTLNAAATTFTTSRIGQNGRYTFSATQGQNMSVVWSGSTFPYSRTRGASTMTVIQPDGTTLSSASFGDVSSGMANGTMDLPDLQQSGTYTIFIDPVSASVGTINIQALADDAQSLAIDGAQLSINLSAGQVGNYQFSGTVGQTLGFGLTQMNMSTYSNPTVNLIPPHSVTPTGPQPVCSWDGASGSCVVGPLWSTDNYTLRITPLGTASLSATLTLSSDDNSQTLTVGGSAKKFTTTRPGRNARFTFSALAQQNLNVLWSNSTLPSDNYCSGNSSTTLQVLAPDGSIVSPSPISIGDINSGGSSGSLSLSDLLDSGTYTLYVQPACAGTGSVNLQVTQTGTTASTSETTAGSMSVGSTGSPASPVAVTVPSGQAINYTFSATQGQHLGLNIGSLQTSGYVTVTVLAPDNSTVLTTNCSYMYAPGGSCSVPGGATSSGLPSTGTYTLRLTPGGNYGATLSVNLYADAQATLVAGTTAKPGSPTTFDNTQTQGQKARFTFNASAGQNLSLIWSSATFSNTNNTLYVYQPDGTPLSGGARNIGAGYAPYASGVIGMTNLPESGNYTVYIDTSTNTGSVGLQLLSDDGQTLTAGKPAQSYSLLANQSGDYQFSGTLGDYIGIGVSSLSTTPNTSGYIAVTLIGPDGVSTPVNTCSSFYASQGGGSCSVSGSTGTIPLGLPATGTYTLHFAPGAGYSASFSLAVSKDQALSLTADATSPTVFSSSTVGQNGRYTFSAKAGQNLTLYWSGLSFPGAVYIGVYNPDGSLLTSRNINNINNGYTNGSISLMSLLQGVTNLQQSGTYTVWFHPQDTSVGSVNLQLLSNVPSASTPGTLAIGGASTSVSLKNGQSADYQFTGTVGQQLGLGLDTFSSATNNASVAITLLGPDGLTVVNSSGSSASDCGIYYSAGGSCNIVLPASGTYTVRVTPQGAYSISLNLTLSADSGLTLAVNGAATTFSTSRTGQNGRLTFTGVSGGQYVLNWSGLVLGTGGGSGGTAYLSVYAPDGSLWLNPTQISTASGSMRLQSLPTDGNYVVFIDPYAANTGQVAFQLVGTTPVAAASADDAADAPLPPWAYAMLGLGLLAALARFNPTAGSGRRPDLPNG